jgi:hypothetical protein
LAAAQREPVGIGVGRELRRSAMADQVRIPDFFADGAKVTPGPYGFTLSFFLSDAAHSGPDQLGRPIARLRIAPELARALARSLSEASSALDGTTQEAAGISLDRETAASER